MGQNTKSNCELLLVYEQARTVHLERRLSSNSRSTLLYRTTSYDFNDDLARTVHAQKASRLAMLRIALFGSYRVIELPEPMFLRALPISVGCAISARIRKRFCAQTSIVSYAIENITIGERMENMSLVKRTIVKLFILPATKFVFKSLDRIAFGTDSSKIAYQNSGLNAGKHSKVSVIEAIEPPCPQCDLTKKGPIILFLGVFEDRKGILELLDVWNSAKLSASDCRFHVAGKGALEDDVIKKCEEVGAIIDIDPSRQRIHDLLSIAKVLVLPSKVTNSWKEQIGLPILEGLSHGCEIVSTDSTGVSTWLAKNRHNVISSARLREDLEAAILRALRANRTAETITRNLPSLSGRQEAENWLLSC